MGNTILLADKSTTIQKIVQLTFADDNYNIQTVSDGEAALEIIPRIQPDLLLADISLPLKNGYELCSIIRNDPQFGAFSGLPVILLAGIYETMDEERSRQVEEKVKQVGANDLLSKPFDPQLLISKVKQYLSSSDVRQEVSSSMFAQEPESAINLFDSEAPVKPPDDTEKTMMLPGGPFGSMFASEPAPLEDEEASTMSAARSAVDIDAVAPANEPIFGEENFPQVELGAESDSGESDIQATLKMNVSKEEDGRFTGREEKEFEYSSGPVLETPASAEAGSIPLILPDAEDPFGDVFQEPQAPWGTTSYQSSEEDSPFGAPELPQIEQPVQTETPSVERAAEEQQQMGAQEEAFDDTWPGVHVRPNMTHAVEELFEAEPVPVLAAEDAEELQADSGEVEPIAEAEEQPVNVSAASGAISDELVERIAERVLSKLSERVVSEIVWQVVPDLAEKMIRRELEKLHASEE